LESPLLTGPLGNKNQNFYILTFKIKFALNGRKLKRQLSKVTIKKAFIEKSIRASLFYSRLYKLKSLQILKGIQPISSGKKKQLMF